MWKDILKINIQEARRLGYKYAPDEMLEEIEKKKERHADNFKRKLDEYASTYTYSWGRNEHMQKKIDYFSEKLKRFKEAKKPHEIEKLGRELTDISWNVFGVSIGAIKLNIPETMEK
tara:strand:- start:196 stop:546 length:351 start_codon:yes stop_codon:yes gene_type:complete